MPFRGRDSYADLLRARRAQADPTATPPPGIDYAGGGSGVTANDIMGQYGPVKVGGPLAPAPPNAPGSGLGQIGQTVAAPPISGGGLGRTDNTGSLGGTYNRGPMANLNPTVGETLSLAQRARLPYGEAGKQSPGGHDLGLWWDMMGMAARMQNEDSPSFHPGPYYVDEKRPYEGYGQPGMIGPSPFATRTPQGPYTWGEQGAESVGRGYDYQVGPAITQTGGMARPGTGPTTADPKTQALAMQLLNLIMPFRGWWQEEHW